MTTVETVADVHLSWPELRRAAHVGIDRYVRALAQRRTLQHGESPDDWQNHVVGAWGECVIAKTTGHYWPVDNDRPDRGAADVGPLHVRTAQIATGRLILHDEDDGDAPFILVVLVRLPRFRIVGWCYGRDGKVPGYWETFTGRPAYFVPQSALRPIGELS